MNNIIDISDNETEAATNLKIDPPIEFHWDDSYGRCVINTRTGVVLCMMRSISRFVNNKQSYYKYIIKIDDDNMICVLCDVKLKTAGGRNSEVDVKVTKR